MNGPSHWLAVPGTFVAGSLLVLLLYSLPTLFSSSSSSGGSLRAADRSSADLAAAHALIAALQEQQQQWQQAALSQSAAQLAPAVGGSVSGGLPAELAAAQALVSTLQQTVASQAKALLGAQELSVSASAAAAAAASAAAAAREADADGCYHVYVDVGTNVAVQFHKLWDPAILLASGPDPWGDSDMRILPFYDQYFGPAPRADVCGFGFEPNPHHAALLRRTVAHYAAAGRRMRVFEAGAGTFDGLGIVTSDNDAINNEWATSIKPLKGEAQPDDIVIPIKDLAAWIVPHVLSRRVPVPADSSKRPPTIVMKLDAENSEESLLTALLDAGALCRIGFVYCDTLSVEYSARLNRELEARGCATVVVKLDDESYHSFRPLWEHTDAAAEQPWVPVPPPT